SGRDLQLTELFTLAGFTFVLAIVLFAFEAAELRSSLRVLIAAIRAMLSGRNENLHDQLPVISRDEVGLLATAFNHLQERVSKQYKEVEQELKLAYNVQQQL